MLIRQVPNQGLYMRDKIKSFKYICAMNAGICCHMVSCVLITNFPVLLIDCI